MKQFIKVNATFDSDGNILPEYIVWNGSRRYKIEKVSDVRYASPPEKSRPEIRYTCRILGRDRFIFYDEGRWYVETNQAKAK